MYRSIDNGQQPIRNHHDPRAFAWELILHTRPGRFDAAKRRAPPGSREPPQAKPSLWKRLAARLRGRSGRADKQDADGEPSASDFSHLGSDATPSYIRRTDTTGDDAESGPARRDLAA